MGFGFVLRMNTTRCAVSGTIYRVDDQFMAHQLFHFLWFLSFLALCIDALASCLPVFSVLRRFFRLVSWSFSDLSMPYLVPGYPIYETIVPLISLRPQVDVLRSLQDCVDLRLETGSVLTECKFFLSTVPIFVFHYGLVLYNVREDLWCLIHIVHISFCVIL